LAEVHLLPCEVSHARAGAFQAEKNVALELILGAGKFFFTERNFFELAELGEDQLDNFENLARRSARVNAQRSGVAIWTEIRVDGVDHSALFTDGLEEARAHAATENGIEDECGIAVVIGDGRCGHTETDLHLLKRLLVVQLNARAGRRRREMIDR